MQPRSLVGSIRGYAKRSGSSSRWLDRARRDPFGRQNQLGYEEGGNYVSRAAHKLVAIDKKFDLFKEARRVIDLGSSPGSWLTIAAERLQQTAASHERFTLIAVDLLELNPEVAKMEEVDFIKGDFLTEAVQFQVTELMQGVEADLILSDMMANTSGNPIRDASLSLELCESAYAFSEKNLAQGGNLVMKFFASGYADEFRRDELQKAFGRVKTEKPISSRKESKEVYWICLDKK